MLEPDIHGRKNVDVELDISNYATKLEVNEATDVDTLDFDGKAVLAVLKLIVDELNIDFFN